MTTKLGSKTKKRTRTRSSRDSTISSAGLRSSLIRAVRDWYVSRTRDERQLPLHNDWLLFTAARKYFDRHKDESKP